MHRFVKGFLLALLIWEVIIAISIVAMYATAHRTSPSTEDKPWLTWAFVLGFVVVLCCWPLCGTLRRVPSTMICSCFGLFIPLLAGWLWGPLMEPRVFSWDYPLIGLDAWIEGLHLSIPSAIAGGIIGYTQAGKLIPKQNATQA
jgi:hypothetical protein